MKNIIKKVIDLVLFESKKLAEEMKDKKEITHYKLRDVNISNLDVGSFNKMIKDYNIPDNAKFDHDFEDGITVRWQIKEKLSNEAIIKDLKLKIRDTSIMRIRRVLSSLGYREDESVHLPFPEITSITENVDSDEFYNYFLKKFKTPNYEC